MSIHRNVLALGAGAALFASMSGYGIALAGDAGSEPRDRGAASSRAPTDIADRMRETCPGHGQVMSEGEIQTMHREMMRDRGMPGM